MTIRAIPTEYNGHTFRSRLEARWAVFFDLADIPYRYEIEGYEDTETGLRYLPDFYLPSIFSWVEVKPYAPSIKEQNKAELAARSRIACRCYIVEGDPFYPTVTLMERKTWSDSPSLARRLRGMDDEYIQKRFYSIDENGVTRIESGVLGWMCDDINRMESGLRWAMYQDVVPYKLLPSFTPIELEMFLSELRGLMKTEQDIRKRCYVMESWDMAYQMTPMIIEQAMIQARQWRFY